MAASQSCAEAIRRVCRFKNTVGGTIFAFIALYCAPRLSVSQSTTPTTCPGLAADPEIQCTSSCVNGVASGALAPLVLDACCGPAQTSNDCRPTTTLCGCMVEPSAMSDGPNSCNSGSCTAPPSLTRATLSLKANLISSIQLPTDQTVTPSRVDSTTTPTKFEPSMLSRQSIELRTAVTTDRRIPEDVISRAACGSNGTVYFRPYSELSNTILRFDIRGHSLAPLVNDTGLAVRDLTTLGNELYVLYGDQSSENSEVREFSPQGGVLNSMHLVMPPGDKRFFPMRIVAFNSGNLLILGGHSTQSAPSSPMFPVAAIFSAQGKFIAYLQNSGNGSTPPTQYVIGSGDTKEIGQMALLALASYGNLAYLMRNARTIAEFNSMGQLQRTVKLDNPGSGARPIDANVLGSTLSVQYIQERNTTLARYDLATGHGQILWDQSDPSTTGAPVCTMADGDILIRTLSSELHRFGTN